MASQGSGAPEPELEAAEGAMEAESPALRLEEPAAEETEQRTEEQGVPLALAVPSLPPPNPEPMVEVEPLAMVPFRLVDTRRALGAVGGTDRPGIDIGPAGIKSISNTYRRAKRIILTAAGVGEEESLSTGSSKGRPRVRLRGEGAVDS